MIKIYIAIFAQTVANTLIAAEPQPDETRRSPNIVVIMADDKKQADAKNAVGRGKYE